MTRDQARAIYKSGEEQVINTLLENDQKIDTLEKKITAQEKTIAGLKKNSSNSSKRPSSDDITKPKKKKEKRNEKRRIGGQPGHKGHFRTPFKKDEIDHFEKYVLNTCPDCHGDLEIHFESPPHIQQQVEMKEVPIITKEHQSYPCWCEKCQKFHYKPFPPEVVKQGLFETRITATVAYMCNVCHASFSTMRKFFRDVVGVKVSRGYLSKVIQKVSSALEDPYQELLNRLPLETTINIDETGHKENKERFWTWVFKAELYVLFRIDKSRGSKVLIDILGEEFEGTIGCDYFSSYRKFMKDFNVSIQFCIAHLIRDIRFLTGLPDSDTKTYGERLLECVKRMFKVIHEHENMTDQQLECALQNAKDEILKAALENVPSCINEDGKELNNEAQNMAKRFRDNGESYFNFITTPGMDPTNNVAEQAIRFVVIDRHIKQGTRSIKGRKANERLWTVIATCALQGRSAFAFIFKAVDAYFHDTPAPSLLYDTS